MNGNAILRLLKTTRNRPLIGPQRLEIEIITVCNMNCLFCWFHSPLVKKRLKKWKLPVGKFLQIANDAKELGIKHLYITGRGEPCLHPNLPEMLRYAHRRQFAITITTNLTLGSPGLLGALSLADTVEVTLCAFPKDRFIRLQSPRQKHLLEIVTKNISTLRKIASVKGRPRIKCNYILTTMNTDNLKDFVSFAEEVGIDEIRFSPLSHVYETRSLRLSKGLSDEVSKQIRLLSQTSTIPLDISWEKLYSLQIKRCYMGWFTLLAGAFGKVKVGCFDSSFPSEGNIYRQSLKEIWFSQRARDTRLRLRDALDRYRFCPFVSSPLSRQDVYCPFALQSHEIEKFISPLQPTYVPKVQG